MFISLTKHNHQVRSQVSCLPALCYCNSTYCTQSPCYIDQPVLDCIEFLSQWGLSTILPLQSEKKPRCSVYM